MFSELHSELLVQRLAHHKVVIVRTLHSWSVNLVVSGQLRTRPFWKCTVDTHVDTTTLHNTYHSMNSCYFGTSYGTFLVANVGLCRSAIVEIQSSS